MKVREEIIIFKKEFFNFDEIDFIINFSGGSLVDVYRIIRILRNNFEKVNVIVLFWVKSVVILLSLGVI